MDTRVPEMIQAVGSTGEIAVPRELGVLDGLFSVMSVSKVQL